MLNDELYASDIKALLEGKMSVARLTEQLKHSEDLECDVNNLLIEIDRITGSQEHPLLSWLYDFLKMIQEECVLHNPVLHPVAENLHAYVSFANLFTSPGRAIAKNDARALELLERALSVNPEYPFTLASLGAIYLDGGKNPQKAYSLFLEAVRINPDYSFALAHLGELLRTGNGGLAVDQQAAYHYLQRAVEADPNNAFALGSLGALLRTGATGVQRDMKRAYKCLTKACEIGPFNPFAFCTLAELLLVGGDGVIRDRRQAMMILEKVLQTSGDYPYALATYGELLRIGGDGVPANRKRAYELLNKAVSIVPNYGYALASLGEILCTGALPDVAPDLSRAYSYLETAYKINPNSTFVLNWFAEVQRVKLELIPARNIAERSLELDPNQPFALAIAAYVYKHVQDASRDIQKAIRLFEKALELDPRHYFSLVELGDSYSKSDPKRAFELYERSTTLNPNNLEVLYYLAGILKDGIEGIPMNLQRANILITHALIIQPHNQTYLKLQRAILEKILDRHSEKKQKKFLSKMKELLTG